MELSIVIPAHNEEKRIAPTLESYLQYFSKIFDKKFEIIVVLNGCTDNTLGVVKKFTKWKQLRYLDIKKAIGKGGAVIEGFKIAKGKLIGFVDADGSTDVSAFYDLVKKINGYDAIIASRWLKQSIVEPKQPLTRRIASRIFNLLVRILFGLNLHDTQCGAKLFKKQAIKDVLPLLGLTRWAFDVDLLYQLKRKGYKILEIPTVWRDKAGSKLNLKKTSLQMFLAILQLRLNHSRLNAILKVFKPLIRLFYSHLEK